MKTITIRTNQGPVVHEAYIHGKFAVNLPFTATFERGDDGEHSYNVTHIATGTRVMGVFGRKAARDYARRLNAALDFDITREDMDNKTDAYRCFVAIVRPIVKGGT